MTVTDNRICPSWCTELDVDGSRQHWSPTVEVSPADGGARLAQTSSSGGSTAPDGGLSCFVDVTADAPLVTSVRLQRCGSTRSSGAMDESACPRRPRAGRRPRAVQSGLPELGSNAYPGRRTDMTRAA